MIRNNIPARRFYSSKAFEDIYNDYLKWQKLPTSGKNLLNKELEDINSEETPALALKRHGTLPPENWLEITDQMRERKDRFYNNHPYFFLTILVEELESILKSTDLRIVNTPRKGRAPIKEVNVLQNGEYLVIVYNRLINSTQTSTVFSGVPIKYIELIDALSFLKEYIPSTRDDFLVESKYYSFDNSISYELRFD